MYRPIIQATARASVRSVLPASRHNISYTSARMGEGDTGGMRSGGEASSDAFSKRETANEAKYVKEREMEKLQALKAKIAAHKQELNELDKSVQNQIDETKEK